MEEAAITAAIDSMQKKLCNTKGKKTLKQKIHPHDSMTSDCNKNLAVEIEECRQSPIMRRRGGGGGGGDGGDGGGLSLFLDILLAFT